MEDLETEILSKFRSVHAFCKQSGINRSTVYMVLKGNYPGNTGKQTARIREALQSSTDKGQLVFDEIKRVACQRCAGRRPGCANCDALFHAQTQAVLGLFSN